MIELSRYARLFRVGDQVYVESILQERSLPADPLLVAVMQALEPRGLEFPSLLAAVQAVVAGASSDAVNGKLGTLHRLGLLPPAAEERAAMFDLMDADVADLPIVDQVELTNHCPMQCLMCPTGQGILTREKGFMDAALFQRVVAEVKDTQPRMKALTLHNLGESLLHPRLLEFIRHARDHGVSTELSANPGLLTLEKYVELEAAGLHRLVLDVDGVDAETLERIRGKPARGSVAFSQLEDVLAYRAEHPRDTPELVLQMIRMPHNAHQHALFLERYAARGIRGVVAYLKEMDANTRSQGEQVFQIGRKPRPYLCRAPWRTVVILWDGRVVPCCHDADAALVLGDMRHQTLREVWAGEPVKRLRQRLREGAPGAPCEGCAHRPDAWVRPSLRDIPSEPLHW